MVIIISTLWCCSFAFFFFSSRRRHTRFDCDWSSDVCSSDLLESSRRRGYGDIEDVQASLRDMLVSRLDQDIDRRREGGLAKRDRGAGNAQCVRRAGRRADTSAAANSHEADAGPLHWPPVAVTYAHAHRLPRQRLRSEEHTSELQSQSNLVCRLLLEKKKNTMWTMM